jgi:hypothetical protein
MLIVSPKLPTFWVCSGHVMQEGCEALGMVFSVPLPEPEIVPTQPLKLMSKTWLKEKLKDFEPSALCVMVVCLDASTLCVLLAMPTEAVPLYFVPFTVTLQALEALELICPYSPEYSISCHPMVVVLFATLWLCCHHSNCNVSQSVTLTLLDPLVAMF